MISQPTRKSRPFPAVSTRAMAAAKKRIEKAYPGRRARFIAEMPVAAAVKKPGADYEKGGQQKDGCQWIKPQHKAAFHGGPIHVENGCFGMQRQYIVEPKPHKAPARPAARESLSQKSEPRRERGAANDETSRMITEATKKFIIPFFLVLCWRSVIMPYLVNVSPAAVAAHPGWCRDGAGSQECRGLSAAGNQRRCRPLGCQRKGPPLMAHAPAAITSFGGGTAS